MDETTKLVLACLASGYIGYTAGRLKWENKKTQRALDMILTINSHYSDILDWIGEHGLNMDRDEFTIKFFERVAFANIVLNES